MENVTETEVDVESLPEAEIEEAFLVRQYDVIILYVPLIALALISNLLVIIVVIKNHYMRSLTNYFLVNLSVADLLVTSICMPISAWKAYTMVWGFGGALCKMTFYLHGVSVAASVFTITAMAVDRYLAITRPFGLYRHNQFHKKTIIIAMTFIWLVPTILFSPMLTVVRIYEDTIGNVTFKFCYENWNDFYISKELYGIVCFVTMFAIPGFIITCAYALMGKTLCSMKPPEDVSEGIATAQQNYRLIRERKRVAWILLLLSLLFAICWLPYNTANLWTDTRAYSTDIAYIKYISTIKRYMLLLGHANSALNPIIYCIMSRNFRKSVYELIFKTKTNFKTKKNLKLRNQLVDSSTSYQRQLRDQSRGMRFVATIRRASPLNRLNQTSQRTTKTCAV